MQLKFKLISGLLMGLVGSAFGSGITIIDVSGTDITSDTTWDSDTNNDGNVDTIYYMDEAVTVKDSSYTSFSAWDTAGRPKVTLTIEPGTVIAGSGSGAGTTGAEVGALLISRAGKIDAQGTVDKPIVFTSASQAEFLYGCDIDGDSFTNTFKPDPVLDGGEWGGVILLGSAQVNNVSGSANTGEKSIEGFPAGSSLDIVYGGGLSPENDDNTGIMRYVRIEFGGFKFDEDDEINGLTMGGVGAGTTLEYIEVVGNTDDGFEWFGGTVNTKYLVSFANQDESFDIDEGHQGSHQFLFALMSTLSDNGTEADGGNGDDKTLAPLTSAKIYNATYVGGGAAGKLGTSAFRLKENHAGEYHNSIFTEFPEWLMRVDDADTIAQVGVNLKFENNIWGTFGLNSGGAGVDTEAESTAQEDAENALLAGSGNTSVGTDPQFSTFVRTSGEVSSIDPRPSISGPAYGNDVTPCGPCAVSYRGAFGSTNWAAGWTYLAENGYFADTFVAPAITVVDVSGLDITADTTWDSDTNDDGVIDQIYFMDEAVTVKDSSYTSFSAWDTAGRPKVTLTIEPGTVIAGSGSGAGTTGAEVGALLVSRAGRVNAAGTAAKPIIFTSASQAEFLYGLDIDGDSFTNTFKPDPVLDGGEWGGVILLGSSVVNNVSGSANTGEKSIEGFPAGSSLDIVYGGGLTPVGDDDSGVLRYVRIEFGGFKFDEDDEINGLTMGGVGSGTEIEYVEVVGNTDDGFEWFGGTVNTKHLVSFFNQDESFDLDEGHQGTHQFLFAVLSSKSDNATEADGGNGDDKTLKPFTLSKFYNATYIGAGEGGKLGTSAFRLKENHGGQYHNSIFTEFPEWLMRVDDADTIAQQTSGTLAFQNNIWGSFGLNPGGAGVDTEAESTPQEDAENALLAGSGNTAVGTTAPFALFARASGEASKIDPRPVLGSSAWGGTLSQGGLCAANYRGAFGTENWAKSWTYMSENGYLVSSFDVPKALTIIDVSGTDITANTTWDSDTDDDGVVDTIYFMDEAVTVKDPSYTSFAAWDSAERPKVTLTIEPGTVIAGSGSGAGTTGAEVGALLITRAGRIDAQGTANNPIVFTSASQAEFLYGCDIDGDSFVNTFKPDPVLDGGEWGGVILLGTAQVNNVSGSANTGEKSIEGFPAGSTLDIVYGGGLSPENGDDSGVMRFVRIEFGGFKFDEDDEINGLTMGGVGSTTDLSYIEVVGNTDDGFEWFGGTVNTKYLVSFANQDESFDIDEGHDAKHQFLFALMSTLSDNGTEADGGNGDDKTLAPLTTGMLYNATYVGGGEAGKLGTSAFRVKENHAGQYHNSIFTEFPEWLMRVDDADTIAQQEAGILCFSHNIWGSFGLNAGGSQTDTEAESTAQEDAEDALLAGLGNTATGTDPQLSVFVRTADEVSTIDPRPSLDGPAWGSNLLDGAPMEVDFRGAFGTENWAQTWTYLSNNGYFEPCFIEDQDIPTASIVVKAGEGIEITSTVVLGNGDVEITVVGDAAGISVLQSNDLDADPFTALDPASYSISGSVITVFAAAADTDPNLDGKDFYQLVK